VGMTRAMRKLYLIHAKSRLRWGERLEQMPSRFLEEIDPAVVQRDSTRRRATNTHASNGGHKRNTRPKQSEYSQDHGNDSYSQTDSELHVGSTVVHATFGRGKLLGIQGSGDMARVMVLFDSVGKKTLILKFAGLKAG
jgi:DNA helicase II / ATP-dependent DNA helicase PcrA